MKITRADVENIAALAKLQFDVEELDKLTGELQTIVTYFEKLNELDTTNIEPIAHIHDIVNVLRADEVKPWLEQDEALKNAPESSNGYFCVPKVIAQDKS